CFLAKLPGVPSLRDPFHTDTSVCLFYLTLVSIKSILPQLAEGGNLALNKSQRESLRKVNTSPIRRRKARPSYSVGFDKYHYRERDVHFDTMDTLPYWYSSKLNIFSDVNGEEFLDAAECWIVDRWGVNSNPWRWDDEPRKQRFTSNQFISTHHNHGTMPTLERFHTYLEWHAMWCTVGELMQRRPLAKATEDNYYTFECQLARAGLTVPPLWLFDLRGPKPLENKLWFTPGGDINEWVEDIDKDEFISETGLADGKDTVIVASSHGTESSKFRSLVRVNTAFVSTKTAASLTRALQTIEDNYDFRIPPDGDHLEINDPPYILTGWLSDNERTLRIDEQDPLKYDVSAIECSPSSKTIEVLNLTFLNDFPTRWVEKDSGETAFIYEAWGDTRGDER
ncbi:MAG: ATP-binding protein, partial [Candidatus Methanospirareceae archaeon]